MFVCVCVYVGGREEGCNSPPPPPVLRREGLQHKQINFSNFGFLILSFCHNNGCVPKILETQNRFGRYFNYFQTLGRAIYTKVKAYYTNSL